MQKGSNMEIPELQGTLPPKCRQDLDMIKTSIRKVLAGSKPDAAISADAFRNVFLTGGTGLIGRFWLKELLQQKEDLIVHCLVRADNNDMAFNRIKDAMVEAEIWDDDRSGRIKAICGDITLERFGLDKSVFDNLCSQIDAIYHLAADVALIGSYDKIREVNARSMTSILELCLQNRLKHLFYASTLGVFPAYFFGFAKEYSGHFISDTEKPDIDEMKRKFPINIVGYLWSKLVSEQAIRYAQSSKMPATIFRLPKTHMASNGYNHAYDIDCRIFGTVMELKIVPPGLSPHLYNEPADILARICTAISFNPQKGYPIYHCSNPNPEFEELKYSDFGINVREVTYEEFRQACQSRGRDSPLYNYWPLLDYLQPYIFTNRSVIDGQPISDRAIRTDCRFDLSWPPLVINHRRTHNWICDNPEKWPWAVPEPQLEARPILERATNYATNLQVPYETAFPEWMQNAVQQQINAILSIGKEKLPRQRISSNAYLTSRSLLKNAELAYELKRFPEILNEKISNPVFIIGINRTGTTLLHRLMSRSHRFWSPLRYEMNDPVLLDGNYKEVAWTSRDPRRKYFKSLSDAINLPERLSGLHDVNPDEPEEDFYLLNLAFTSWVLTVVNTVPGYADWIIDTGSGEAYRHHRRILQHFSWQRKQKFPHDQRNWLLKMPFHLKELETLLETYPDAVFIQTHRAPDSFMGSWFSFVERMRTIFGDEQSRIDIGRQQLAFMSDMLNEAMAIRKSSVEIDNRFMDVHYLDLVKDPIETVHRIYDHFKWELDNQSLTNMQTWLARQDRARKKESRHKYDINDYGISSDDIIKAFDPYLRFANQRGLFPS
ncbi:MAG: NAD-dependent epimerase/dehydratase family protein, partial [Rhodobacteraceae bacterium]|nr:NAD-dependent epimerase/dehydratase family protein [Paracoccaceae bacterium]MYG43378.1 NAD-dependent epimerase/dehydratase family protein [Paracoccaceae bacterium]